MKVRELLKVIHVCAPGDINPVMVSIWVNGSGKVLDAEVAAVRVGDTGIAIRGNLDEIH